MYWNEKTLNKILLVEDDPVHARIMRKAFEESPHQDQIIHLSDGESVIEALFPDHPSQPSGQKAPAGTSPNNTAAANASGDTVNAGKDKDAASSASQNRQFVDQTDNTLPSLILLDLRLPAVDGFEVLQAIRSNERTRQIPVIVVSTSERQGDIRHCYQLGANAYITKPVDYNIFIEKLRALRQFWLVSAELPDEDEV